MTSHTERLDDALGLGGGRQFQAIIEAIPSAVFIYQGDKVLYTNRDTESFTGYSKKELLAMPFWGFVHPDFKDLIQQRGRARQDSGDVPDNYDFKIVRKDGEIRWVNWRANVIELNGKPAVMGVGDDITERVQGCERMKQYEHQRAANIKLGLKALAGLELDDLFQKTTELIAETLEVEYCKVQQLQPDGEKLLLRAGVGWQQGLIGFACVGTGLESQAGFTLKSRHPVIVKDLRIETRFSGPALLHDHGVMSGISVVIGSIDQPWGVLGAHSKALRDFSDCDIDFIQTLANTLSLAIERKQTEQTLQANEKKYRGMVMNLMEGFYSVTRDGLLQEYNLEFCKILGLDPDRNHTGIALPDFWQNSEDRKAYAKKLKADGFIKHYEVNAKKVNGEKIVVLVNARLIKTDDGNPLLIEGTFLDITERKRTEKALDESKKMYQSVVEQVSDGIAIVQDGKVVYVNPSIARMWGKPAEDIVGRHFLDVIHPDEHERLAAIYKQRMAGGGPVDPYEIRAIRANGDTLWVEMTGSRIQYQGRPADLVSVRDISKRKKDEEQLLKLSSAIEQAGEAIIITDKAGIIEYVNPAFAELTGYSAEEAIGQTPRLLNSGNQDAAFYKDMWDTVTSGNVWHGKVIDKKKDGSFYPTTLTISPIIDKLERITHFVGIQSDLTKHEELEHQFHQAQKMEAIGTLVGGIAHDFNNMLAGMTGNLYLAQKRTSEMPDVAQKLSNVEQLSFRAAEMIQQLLTFARKDRVTIKQIPFRPLIKEALKLLRSSIPENIQLHQDICSEDLKINGDSTQLHQVLMNLLNNARDAVEGVDEASITVSLERFHADAQFVENRADFTAGFYAHLSVQDNGIGIPESQVQHLFEPFFTTKEQGKGTGLGLAMVFGAVKTHHGFIEVESVEGTGSSFHVYLPLLEPEEAVSSELAQALGIVEGNDELILLVDDERQILETGKEVLESLGYRVLTAINGREAVELFESRSEQSEQSERIDLCIFDIVMPVMGGDLAAKRIRQMNPTVKIIFATGYDKNLQTDMQHEVVLSKPFLIAEMSQLIRQQLDS